ncbi:MAG: CAP domain-containing protein [Candidatus Absconditabacteria bacterium]|nr:CAP domain-containing protein [Candidatus Absconditabacteria bacterium]
MNIKTGVMIGSLALAVVLPFSSNGQEIVNKAKKDLIENLDEKNIFLGYKLDKEEQNKLIKETIFEVNKFRKENGLEDVAFEEKTQEIAQQYADYCAKYNWKRGHKDMNGRGLQERCNQNNYYGIARENLFFGIGSPNNVVKTRIDYSEGHKKNMIDKDSKNIGVGIAKFENDTYIYVLILSY